MPARRYRKKGKYGGMPRRGLMRGNIKASSSARQLAVMVNPFSTATTSPKIPDGLANISAGLRLQVAGPIEARFNATVIHVIMHPGLPSGLITCLTAVDAPRPVPNSTNYWPYANHFKLGPNHQGEYFTITQDPATAIAKWRLVSQGLRLSLVNNSDNNEGWWQAVRIQLDPNETGIRGSPMAGADADSRTVLIGRTADPTVGWDDTEDSIPGNNLTREMLENTTYQSGKLRDIHKHLFTLNPETEKHPFTRLSSVHTQDYIDKTADSPFLDKSFDALYIRIYATDVTKLLVHMVSNQEVMYDENTHLVRYQSECSPPVSNIEKVFERMKVTRPSRLVLP